MDPGSTFYKIAENSQWLMAQKLHSSEENYFPLAVFICVCAYKPYRYGLCTKYTLEIWLKPFLLSVCKFDILIPEWFYSMLLTFFYSDYFMLLCIMQKCQLNSILIWNRMLHLNVMTPDFLESNVMQFFSLIMMCRMICSRPNRIKWSHFINWNYLCLLFLICYEKSTYH